MELIQLHLSCTSASFELHNHMIEQVLVIRATIEKRNNEVIKTLNFQKREGKTAIDREVMLVCGREVMSLLTKDLCRNDVIKYLKRERKKGEELWDLSVLLRPFPLQSLQ